MSSPRWAGSFLERPVTTAKCPYRHGMPEIPPRIRALPVDERGYPVPWFVAWIDGKPDFRLVHPETVVEAIRLRKCWVCGDTLGKHTAFVIGPMCVVNRVSAEPPMHVDCAEFSAKACPFLTLPKAQRREANLPERGHEVGFMIRRNPGCCVVWETPRYRAEWVGNGYLFRLGSPISLRWYAEGRAATRAEVLASVQSGLPILRKAATDESGEAVAALDEMIAEGMALLPSDEGTEV